LFEEGCTSTIFSVLNTIKHQHTHTFTGNTKNKKKQKNTIPKNSGCAALYEKGRTSTNFRDGTLFSHPISKVGLEANPTHHRRNFLFVHRCRPRVQCGQQRAQMLPAVQGGKFGAIWRKKISPDLKNN
jgi:hypothetical protein